LITGKSSGTRIWMCLRTEFNFFRRRSSIQTGTCRIMSWIPATWNLLRNANYLRRKVYAESVCDSLFAEMKPWNHVSLLTSYCRRLRRPQHKKIIDQLLYAGLYRTVIPMWSPGASVGGFVGLSVRSDGRTVLRSADCYLYFSLNACTLLLVLITLGILFQSATILWEKDKI
jgi:hypothetical protein